MEVAGEDDKDKGGKSGGRKEGESIKTEKPENKIQFMARAVVDSRIAA